MIRNVLVCSMTRNAQAVDQALNKICKGCNLDKPIGAFASHGIYVKKDGTSVRYLYLCRDCHDNYRQTARLRDPEGFSKRARARGHGMTAAQLDAMYLVQKGRCAICERHYSLRKLHIDHNHKTGSVRGLLCQGCNHGIGNFMDSPEMLSSAIKYLDNRALL